MSSELDKQRQAEQEYWNECRPKQAGALVDAEDVKLNLLRPCYEGKGDHYSENRMLFHQIIERDGGWVDKYMLDYGCGLGNWAIYFGLTGARKVVGFDMSESGIKLGMEQVRNQGLESTVELVVADATNLPFSEDEFDIVVGTGILHHTIKYPGIFENLYRVMKPGTKAYFLENLADFPLWKLWWWWKGEVPEGDVPIFSKEIREKASMFSDVEIVGDTFLHVHKLFTYKKDMGSVRRKILKATHKTDTFLFEKIPALRKWGNMSVIVLTK